MSDNKEVGEFSFKAVTFTLTPGQASGVQMQANFEGTSAGFGHTLGTMTVLIAGDKQGRWEWCGANFPAAGCSLTGRAQGRFGDAGPNRWRTQGLLTVSNGQCCLVDGELDLVERSWTGRLVERG